MPSRTRSARSSELIREPACTARQRRRCTARSTSASWAPKASHRRLVHAGCSPSMSSTRGMPDNSRNPGGRSPRISERGAGSRRRRRSCSTCTGQALACRVSSSSRSSNKAIGASRRSNSGSPSHPTSPARQPGDKPPGCSPGWGEPADGKPSHASSKSATMPSATRRKPRRPVARAPAGSAKPCTAGTEPGGVRRAPARRAVRRACAARTMLAPAPSAHAHGRRPG